MIDWDENYWQYYVIFPVKSKLFHQNLGRQYVKRCYGEVISARKKKKNWKRDIDGIPSDKGCNQKVNYRNLELGEEEESKKSKSQ